MDPPHPLMEGHVETGKAILHASYSTLFVLQAPYFHERI